MTDRGVTISKHQSPWQRAKLFQETHTTTVRHRVSNANDNRSGREASVGLSLPPVEGVEGLTSCQGCGSVLSFCSGRITAIPSKTQYTLAEQHHLSQHLPLSLLTNNHALLTILCGKKKNHSGRICLYNNPVGFVPSGVFFFFGELDGQVGYSAELFHRNFRKRLKNTMDRCNESVILSRRSTFSRSLIGIHRTARGFSLKKSP